MFYCKWIYQTLPVSLSIGYSLVAAQQTTWFRHSDKDLGGFHKTHTLQMSAVPIGFPWEMSRMLAGGVWVMRTSVSKGIFAHSSGGRRSWRKSKEVDDTQKLLETPRLGWLRSQCHNVTTHQSPRKLTKKNMSPMHKASWAPPSTQLHACSFHCSPGHSHKKLRPPGVEKALGALHVSQTGRWPLLYIVFQGSAWFLVVFWILKLAKYFDKEMNLWSPFLLGVDRIGIKVHLPTSYGTSPCLAHPHLLPKAIGNLCQRSTSPVAAKNKGKRKVKSSPNLRF